MKDERAKWDEAAPEYQSVFRLGLNDYNSALLRFWQENGMLTPGCRVIDIGCGVGKYGAYLAGLGCDVTLTDIAENMIAHARENMAPYKTPWRAVCCDFNEISGREEAFAEGFDLAISTMSPAIHDAATVKKMSCMTRSWCFTANFYEWRQPLRDALMKEIGIEPRPMHTGDLKADCAALIQAVTDAGYVPQVKYVDYNWSDKRGAEGMAEYMRRNYFADELNADALCAAALVILWAGAVLLPALTDSTAGGETRQQAWFLLALGVCLSAYGWGVSGFRMGGLLAAALAAA